MSQYSLDMPPEVHMQGVADTLEMSPDEVFAYTERLAQLKTLDVGRIMVEAARRLTEDAESRGVETNFDPIEQSAAEIMIMQELDAMREAEEQEGRAV